MNTVHVAQPCQMSPDDAWKRLRRLLPPYIHKGLITKPNLAMTSAGRKMLEAIEDNLRTAAKSAIGYLSSNQSTDTKTYRAIVEEIMIYLLRQCTPWVEEQQKIINGKALHQDGGKVLTLEHCCILFAARMVELGIKDGHCAKRKKNIVFTIRK